MFNLRPPALARAYLAAIVTFVVLGLAACGDLAAALPTRPTPFPTLARLPSVTPVTPSPPTLASATPASARTPTPALSMPSVLVTVEANVRSGPGLDFAVVTVLRPGASITLRRRQGEWYQIRSADGTQGWMSGQILDIPPEVAAQVPQEIP